MACPPLRLCPVAWGRVPGWELAEQGGGGAGWSIGIRRQPLPRPVQGLAGLRSPGAARGPASDSPAGGAELPGVLQQRGWTVGWGRGSAGCTPLVLAMPIGAAPTGRGGGPWAGGHLELGLRLGGQVRTSHSFHCLLGSPSPALCVPMPRERCSRMAVAAEPCCPPWLCQAGSQLPSPGEGLGQGGRGQRGLACSPVYIPDCCPVNTDAASPALPRGGGSARCLRLAAGAGGWGRAV